MHAENLELTPLSVVVHDSVAVSDVVIITIITMRLTTWKAGRAGSEMVVSIAEYRRLLGDHVSTDQRIGERLRYLEAFCRNIIRPELENIYDKGKEVTIN